MEVRILSKKTSGGLFVQFEIHSPDEVQIDGLMMEPPGGIYRKLCEMEESLRGSGEVRESPDTGFQERIEPMSDTSYVCGGSFEARDEAASEVLIARLSEVLEGAEIEVDYL